MSDPWFKFYPSDWLAGTRGLSAAETGIYITLIAMMYERTDPLPHDNSRLARLCGCPAGAFKRCLDGLMATKKIIIKDGGLWNERVEKERYSRDVASQNASDAAKKRWSIQGDKIEQNQQKPDAVAVIPQCDVDATRAPVQKPDTRKNKNTVDAASPAFDAFWSVYPKKVEKKAAKLRFEKAVKAGADPGQIIAAATVYAKTDGVIRGYAKNPDAWLNGERWTDEITPASQQSSQAKSSTPTRNEFWRKVAGAN